MPKCSFCEIRGWGGKAFCLKIDDYVGDDFYDEFCNSYTYDRCPHYQKSTNGGCYLTTACVNVMNLPDNCTELETLRSFRDNYILSKVENGAQVIDEYYRIAPLIISSINEQVNADEIWRDLYYSEILPCVELINKNKLQETYDRYCLMTKTLSDTYLK